LSKNGERGLLVGVVAVGDGHGRSGSVAVYFRAELIQLNQQLACLPSRFGASLLISHEKVAVGTAFPVSITTDEEISQLRKAILKVKPNRLKGVDADELEVWKLCTPRPSNKLTPDFIETIQLVNKISASTNTSETAFRLYSEEELGDQRLGEWPDERVHTYPCLPMCLVRFSPFLRISYSDGFWYF
jgi:hypothetical protein